MARSVTRRSIVAGSAAFLLARQTAFAKASQPATALRFAVPAHACDCHTHIHGDPARFPFWEGRGYTPETALPEEMAALHRALGIERVVIVTPSVYGTDNSATLYGMRARGPSARGVATIGAKTTEAELDAMHRAGFRGVRLNLAASGVNDPEAVRALVRAAIDRVRGRKWHVQVYAPMGLVGALRIVVESAPVPVVFDHFGGAKAGAGLGQAGFGDLLALVHSGKAYVKISAAYRVTERPGDYSDVMPFARALIGANPDRILWGSDWPHPDSAAKAGRKATDLAPLLQIDDGLVLNQLAVWAPDAGVRKTILVDNPARLYGF